MPMNAVPTSAGNRTPRDFIVIDAIERPGAN